MLTRSATALSTKRILLVDSDSDARSVYGLALAQAGFDVHVCIDLDEAFGCVARLRPRLVILGEIEPDGDPVTIADRLRRLGDCDQVLCVRAWPECEGCGCDARFQKPLPPFDLVREVTVRIGVPEPVRYAG